MFYGVKEATMEMIQLFNWKPINDMLNIKQRKRPKRSYANWRASTDKKNVRRMVKKGKSATSKQKQTLIDIKVEFLPLAVMFNKIVIG